MHTLRIDILASTESLAKLKGRNKLQVVNLNN